MLANGIKLKYKTTESGTYTELDSIKKVPDIGFEPEKVENTRLNAKNKQYEIGIGDLGDLEYTFDYEGNKQGTETHKLLDMCKKAVPVYWEQEYPDGTKFRFQATPAYKLTGGELNAVVELVITLTVASDVEIVEAEA